MRSILVMVAVGGAGLLAGCGDTTETTAAEPPTTTTEASAPETTTTTTTTTEAPGTDTSGTMPATAPATVAVVCAVEPPDPPVIGYVERPAVAPPGEPLESASVRAVTQDLEPDLAARGVLVPWPDGADVIDSVTVEGDRLVIDFRPGVEGTFTAAPGTSAVFFGAFLETAFRADGVAEVEFRIGGSPATFDDWWQTDGAVYARDDWRATYAAPAPDATC